MKRKMRRITGDRRKELRKSMKENKGKQMKGVNKNKNIETNDKTGKKD